MDAGFLGHVMYFASVKPNESKVEALSRRSMSRQPQQLRSLLGDLKVLRGMNVAFFSPLKQGFEVLSIPAMETSVSATCL